MHLIFIIVVVFTLFSCSTNKNEDKDYSSKIGEHPLIRVQLQPSQLNECNITIDRTKDILSILVDSTPVNNFRGIPKTIQALKIIEENTNIEALYDTIFVLNNKENKSKAAIVDGISINFFYSVGDYADTIYVGNNPTPELSSTLQEQIQLLMSNSKDSTLKVYLGHVYSYF